MIKGYMLKYLDRLTGHYLSIPFITLRGLYRCVIHRGIKTYQVYSLELRRVIFTMEQNNRYTFDGGLADKEYYAILDYLQKIFGDDYSGPTKEEIRSYFY